MTRVKEKKLVDFFADVNMVIPAPFKQQIGRFSFREIKKSVFVDFFKLVITLN